MVSVSLGTGCKETHCSGLPPDHVARMLLREIARLGQAEEQQP